MAKIGIFVGTVYGHALLVAEEAQPMLQEKGHEVKVFEDGTLEDWQQYSHDVVLVITSTTGQGQLPDNIRALFASLQDQYQPALRYGVIALGDSSFGTFCGGGKQFDALLQEQGAQRVGELLEVDASVNPEPENVAIPWVEEWMTQL